MARISLFDGLRARIALMRARRDDLVKSFASANPVDRSAMASLIRTVHTYRSGMIIALIAAFLANMALVYQIKYATLPPPIVLTVDQHGVVDRVAVVRDDDGSLREKAIEHFLWQWLQCRESYHLATYIIQFRTCKYMAKKESLAFVAFDKEFSRDNPDGVFLKHGGLDPTGSIVVEWGYAEPTALAVKNAKTKMVSVHFYRTEKIATDPNPKRVRYVATIEYELSNLPMGPEAQVVNPIGLQIINHIVNKEELK